MSLFCALAAPTSGPPLTPLSPKPERVGKPKPPPKTAIQTEFTLPKPRQQMPPKAPSKTLFETMNQDETPEPSEPAPLVDEQQPLPPKPKIERVKKDLPKKKWRKQGLRKSTRNRK